MKFVHIGGHTRCVGQAVSKRLHVAAVAPMMRPVANNVSSGVTLTVFLANVVVSSAGNK